MKEIEINKNSVEQFNLIQFGGRSFFIPLRFHATIYVSDDGNELTIIIEGGKGAYCLVNGIRCSDLIYNKEKDTVNTSIEQYTMDGVPFLKNDGTVSTMDGVQCTSPISVKFQFDDQEFLWNNKKIVPQRHYEELTSSFLSETPQLDKRIHAFLQKHPECFGNGSSRGSFPPNYVNEWVNFHTNLTLFETDKEYREHVKHIRNGHPALEDAVFQLFIEETFGA